MGELRTVDSNVEVEAGIARLKNLVAERASRLSLGTVAVVRARRSGEA